MAIWKERSIFWTRLWIENGRPNEGILCEVAKKAKRDYKRESRRVIRNQKQLTAERMAQSLLCNRQRDFWDEINRKKRKGRPSPPNVMDGVSGNDDVCGLFRSKYDELYNSVSFDAGEMSELYNELCVEENEKCQHGVCTCSSDERPLVSPQCVHRAVKKMKSNKSDGVMSIVSDHFRNACFELFVHLSILFGLMLLHSYAPRDMSISTLIPIPKNLRKSLSDSNNYRSIALSSLTCKILDNVILDQHLDVFKTSPLQFGFKADHSTTACSFLLQEVLEHFSANGSPVYVALLDATKAFDRVHFLKLFRLLHNRNICPRLMKLLLNMYTSQELIVKWNGKSSDAFKCSNGVKQGGVLSPTLFCVYLDELLKSLSDLNIGCFMGHHFTGALAYADDVTLLAPSVHAMQRMLKTCEDFSRQYNVKFNSSKCSLIVHNGVNENVNLYLSEEKIPVVDCTVYLGSFIGNKHHKKNINKACSDMITRTNVIMSQFRNCSPDVRKSLFLSYCSSFYGSPLWKLQSKHMERLSSCWRSCIRHLFLLPLRCHSRFIPLLMNSLHIQYQLLIRFFNFFFEIMYLFQSCSHVHQ